MQPFPSLMQSCSLQSMKTFPDRPENWNMLKEKRVEVPSPFPSTVTVGSAGLAQLVQNKKTSRIFKNL